MRAVKHWKRLPSKAVESPSLETSKMWPDKALGYHKLSKLVPTLQLAWLDEMGNRASFQHKLFYHSLLLPPYFLCKYNLIPIIPSKLSQYLNRFIPRQLACFHQDEGNWIVKFLDYDFFVVVSMSFKICLTVISVYTALITITSPVRML